MPTFTPPADRSTARTLADDQTSRGYRLMRHFPPIPCGRNVFLVMRDDTLVATDVQPLNLSDALRTFYGGHVDYEVNDVEAAALVAAGYEVTP